MVSKEEVDSVNLATVEGATLLVIRASFLLQQPKTRKKLGIIDNMNKHTLLQIIAIVGLCLSPLSTVAQVYQWCIKLPTEISKETNNSSEAWLWIPDTCSKVKALMFSQQNMTEETIFNSPRFREQLSRMGVGIVWVAPSFDQRWEVAKGSNDVFDWMMSEFSRVVGCDLTHTPIIPIGHSAMATMPWNFAAWNQERTLAIISYHGDAPRTNLCGYGGENLEWGRTRNIDGIPGLMIEGEHEWWEARVNPALAFRIMYPSSCISFLCDAGHGHFDASEQVLDYMAMFIEKALQYRLGADGKMTKLDPTAGWLCKRWDAADTMRPAAAPYAEYKGDRHDAFWYFDGEIASQTERLYSLSLGRKTQYVGYTVGGRLLDYSPKLHAGTIIDAPLEADGLTFHIGATYTDSTRMKTVEAHSSKGIKISVVNGAVKQINDTTFQMAYYYPGEYNERRSYDLWLQALGEGDDQYKGAAQQLCIRYPHKISDGRDQTISFPALSDMQKAGSRQRLKATSTSGLEVGYFVKQGPAVIEDGCVRLLPIPPCATNPLKVVVVAWQHGIKGEWNTAKTVSREFYVKP